MLKKIGLVVVLLVIGLFIGGNYLWSNLDGIVKKAVETYGSAATQSEVRLDRIHIAVTEGSAQLANLTVGNPTGFSSARAFALGSIAVKLDPKSIMGTGPILIHEIKIEKPELVYEVLQNGETNLQTLTRNGKAYADRLAKSVPTTAQPKEAEASKTEPAAEGRKIIIEHLFVSEGKIDVRHALLGDQKLSADLPTLHLKDIGKATQGASAAEVADMLIRLFSENATKAALPNLTKQLEVLKGAALEKINRATESALGNAASSKITDQLAPQVGSKIKGLLKK